ncbi:MAG: IS66 family transposase [Candidatus Zixiibacteriota bacterium]
MHSVVSTMPEFDELRLHLQRLEQENELLREQVRLLRAQLFGRKSERFKVSDDSQFLLFNESVAGLEKALEPEEIEVPAHTRKKVGRKPLPEDLPRVDVIHDISAEEKICDCGCTKSRIGEEISEQLDIIPASFRVIRHIRPKYACRRCEGVEDDGPTVAIAPPPAQIIPKSIVSAGLLAHVLVTKFADAVPFYRQEGQFSRLGVEINRTSMCNWAMQAAETCQPLLELLHKEILSGPLINVDETTVQVLSEPGRSPTQKSYMWLFRGGDPERPALEFQYHPTREGEVAATYLNDYKGYVQTDGYVGYDFIDRRDDIIHVGCWAHARRKFVELIKSAGKNRSQKKIGVAEKAVEQIRQLYAIEKDARNRELGAAEIYQLRQEKSRPLVAAFHGWLLEHSAKAPPKSLLGKAISYALGQWPRLEKYLEDGRLRMDNNLAENAIRPFVVGRKNWLFSGNAEGARASAAIYSLIENAKANGLEPYWYLRHLFERLPLAKSEDKLRALLPQYIDREMLSRRQSD